MSRVKEKFLINNTLSGQQWIEEAFRDQIIVGRHSKEEHGMAVHASDNFPVQLIALQSRFISLQHARFIFIENQWTVENISANSELILNGASLLNFQTANFERGAELRIGEFSLALVDTAQLEQEENVDLRTSFIEIERDIHQQLLKWIELRRDENIDLETDVARERILSYLDLILGDLLERVDRKFVVGASRLAFYNRLSYMITASNKSYGQSHTKYLQNKQKIKSYDTALVNLEKQFMHHMGITCDATEMEKNIFALDEKYAQCHSRFELDFSRALQVHLIREQIRHNVFDLVFGLGPLQDLIEMDCISEIMVVSKSQIFVEKFGVVEDSRRAFFNDDMLIAVIERIVQPLGRRVDRSSPMVDARLADGSRVNAIVPPLAVKGPCLTIRKFSKTPLEMEDLIGFGAITQRTAAFLQACVANHQNIVVSGGTGTGKTTLLNCLSGYIPHKERIVTIEDTAEVQLKQPHVVTLEARPANMEGAGAITIQDLVKNSLRMRPDRIVVGECRGSEALDMLQAMNTGHDGSMTTAHANSPAELILRVETMVLMGVDMPIKAVREQVVAAVDVIVQLTRFPDGRRCVTHISEVVGINEETDEVIVEDIFRFVSGHNEGGLDKNEQFTHTGHMPHFIDALMQKSSVQLTSFF